MRHNPLNLLLVGYGLTTVLMLVFLPAGTAMWLQILAIWLMGPVMVLALAVTPYVNQPFLNKMDTVSVHVKNDSDAENYRLWEDDLMAELHASSRIVEHQQSNIKRSA